MITWDINRWGRYGRWPTIWRDVYDPNYKGGKWVEEHLPAGLNWYEALQ